MKKKDIEEFIAYKLHELTWRHKYSLNKGIAIWSFLNGIKKAGFKVSSNKSPFPINYVFQYKDETHELFTEMSENDILRGWKQNPPASPMELYNSIYLMIDRLQEGVKKQFPKISKLNFYKVPTDLSNALSSDRHNKAKQAREYMEESLLNYFNKYYEDVLQPSNLDLEKPGQSKILSHLFESDIFNTDRMNQAIAESNLQDNSGFTNPYSTIAFLKDGIPLEEGFIVSNSRIEDYMWGTFLLELAKSKKYTLIRHKGDCEENEYGFLEIACDIGWNILEIARLKK